MIDLFTKTIIPGQQGTYRHLTTRVSPLLADSGLITAVTGHGEEFVLARVQGQIKLSSLVMVTGDPGEAAVIGGQALDSASTIRSRRAADDMRDLRRFSEPHERLTVVAELTHRIGSVMVL